MLRSVPGRRSVHAIYRALLKGKQYQLHVSFSCRNAFSKRNSTSHLQGNINMSAVSAGCDLRCVLIAVYISKNAVDMAGHEPMAKEATSGIVLLDGVSGSGILRLSDLEKNLSTEPVRILRAQEHRRQELNAISISSKCSGHMQASPPCTDPRAFWNMILASSGSSPGKFWKQFWHILHVWSDPTVAGCADSIMDRCVDWSAQGACGIVAAEFI